MEKIIAISAVYYHKCQLSEKGIQSLSWLLFRELTVWKDKGLTPPKLPLISHSQTTCFIESGKNREIWNVQANWWQPRHQMTNTVFFLYVDIGFYVFNMCVTIQINIEVWIPRWRSRSLKKGKYNVALWRAMRKLY